MKAIEAKTLSLKHKNDALQQIFLNIKKCCEEGSTRTQTWNYLSKSVILELQNLGYQVIINEQNNSCFISWE